MNNLEKVFVYRNLHKKCWSVKSRKTGRVIAHLDYLCLKMCDFKVSENGRQKVLLTKQKNVHAGVSGTISDPDENEICTFKKVKYNPYKYSSFVDECDKPVLYATEVHMTKSGEVWIRQEL